MSRRYFLGEIMQVIAYTNEGGGVSIVIPTDEALSTVTIDEIAQKDVPDGKPYSIVDSGSLPSRATRNSWVIIDGVVVAS